MSVPAEDMPADDGQIENDHDSESEEEETDVHQQISELAQKQQEVLAALSSLSSASTRSYVYVPRERHIPPFSGDIDKDGRSVDEFIEEVERVVSARNQSPLEQFDFVMSLLRGSALEEVRLRKNDRTDQISDLFCYLQEAFGDKRSASQLLQNFYSYKQSEDQSILDFSHGLSQTLNLVTRHYPGAVAKEGMALRDQFVEGVRDTSLRRELRKYVRMHPKSTLIDVRDEAYLWASEESPVSTKNVKSKARAYSFMSTDAQCAAMSVNDDQIDQRNVIQSPPEQGRVNTMYQVSKKNVGLDDVVKLLAEQGKVITELTQAVKDLTTQNKSNVGVRQPVTPKFTADGKPICFKCQIEGHVAKQCPQKRNQRAEGFFRPTQQGNENPWLQ